MYRDIAILVPRLQPEYLAIERIPLFQLVIHRIEQRSFQILRQVATDFPNEETVQFFLPRILDLVANGLIVIERDDPPVLEERVLRLGDVIPQRGHVGQLVEYVVILRFPAVGPPVQAVGTVEVRVQFGRAAVRTAVKGKADVDLRLVRAVAQPSLDAAVDATPPPLRILVVVERTVDAHHLAPGAVEVERHQRELSEDLGEARDVLAIDERREAGQRGRESEGAFAVGVGRVGVRVEGRSDVPQQQHKVIRVRGCAAVGTVPGEFPVDVWRETTGATEGEELYSR